MSARKRNFYKTDAFAGLLLCVLVCAGIVWARAAGVFQATELAVYDYYIRYQPCVSAADNRITLLTISERDIQKLGSWPLNDGLLAQLVKNLLAHQPRIIGLDIFRNIEVPPGSEDLMKLFSEAIPVVTIMKFADKLSPGVPRPYVVRDGGLVGFGDSLIDPGGITRRGLLFMDDGKESYTAFNLLLALAYLQKEGIGAQPDPETPGLMKLGKTTFVPLSRDAGAYINADTNGYQYLLDFSSAKPGFPSISLSDALADRIPDELVRDKIIVVGATAESLRDFFSIPIERSSEEGQRIYGIELHATTISQLLRSAIDGQKPMRYWSERVEIGWTVFWGLMGFLVCLRVASFRKFSVCLVVFPAALAGITFFAFRLSFWLPVIPPALAFVMSADFFRLYQLSVEKRQRALLMRLFESHVSKDIAKAIWAQREQFVSEGLPRPQQLIATVLFTDLKGFTTISEQFGDPGKLMDWLNEYMEAMTNHVLSHGGVINKYIGDAVMAVFGVPVARSNEEQISRDAVNAILCAKKMGAQLEELNARWKGQNRPTVKMRVGIHTGPLVVGCIGSRQRLEYTVIGDTVNVASRLEGINKDYDSENICRILIGESTLRYSGDRFRIRPLGELSLKGKGKSLPVFQVLRDSSEDEGKETGEEDRTHPEE
ncbi:MAG: adenylate/guanylate cyclase domain-containing protein [Desulfobacteraceae bacterium]|nr:adenylate/guanylate cyclase domain-containing protein [Desulfobacteraceae bacterium]